MCDNGPNICDSCQWVPGLTGNEVCWLLGTSVQEIGILHAIEQAFVPKHLRCEYNKQRPCYSYFLARCLFSRRRGSISWVVYSLYSSNESVPAVARSKHIFLVGSNHRRLPLCWARLPT